MNSDVGRERCLWKKCLSVTSVKGEKSDQCVASVKGEKFGHCDASVEIRKVYGMLKVL